MTRRQHRPIQAGHFTLDDLSLPATGGAVARLGPLFIDRTGGLTRTPFDQRAIAISAEDIRHIPTVIAVAGGPTKVEPVRVAPWGGWLHGLATDADTARGILSDADSAPGDEGGWYTV